MQPGREVPPTKRGYNTYEVVSALQKAIRRSDVDNAIYWGAELYESGFGAWAWKRIKVIVSEDIGPAAPGLPADVHALYETAGGKPEANKGALMYFVHAVILCARAPKSRVVDWALFSVANVNREVDNGREIPDEALDMHTMRGAQMDRGQGHFVSEAAKLEQPNAGSHKASEGQAIPAELLRLEERYRAEFMLDQAKWRDPNPELEEEAEKLLGREPQRKEGRILP